MSESRPEKRKIEMIESYWTGGEYGSDYKWDDNHGELVRCKDCKHWEQQTGHCPYNSIFTHSEWFCADGEKR